MDELVFIDYMVAVGEDVCSRSWPPLDEANSRHREAILQVGALTCSIVQEDIPVAGI